VSNPALEIELHGCPNFGRHDFMICSRPIPFLAVNITVTSVVLGDGTPEGVDVISESPF
jgi:hypothetical protein